MLWGLSDMAVLALKKSTWDGASQRDKDIFRAFGYYLQLGNPAVYEDPSTDQWYIFSDGRFEPDEICYFGALAANAASFPAGYTTDDKSRRQIAKDARYWLQGGGGVEGGAAPVDRGLTLPGAISYPDPNPNYWQSLLDAQGTPSWLKMADAVPGTWTPVGDE